MIKDSGPSPGGGRVERFNLSSPILIYLTWVSHFKTKIKTYNAKIHLVYLYKINAMSCFLKLYGFTQTNEVQLMPTNVSGNDITGTRQDEQDSKKHTFDKPVANNKRYNKEAKLLCNPTCTNVPNIHFR